MVDPLDRVETVPPTDEGDHLVIGDHVVARSIATEPVERTSELTFIEADQPAIINAYKRGRIPEPVGSGAETWAIRLPFLALIT
jgi:hypothetical protein